MSFSSNRKDEIIAHQYKSKCCKKALLSGALFAKGELKENKIYLSVENLKYAEYIKSLIYDVCGKDTEVFVPESGGRRVMLSFWAPTFVKYLSEISTSPVLSAKCPSCPSSFFRGIFLVSGRACDPDKQYRLEFSAGQRISQMKEFFRENSLFFSEAKQGGKSILYTGKASVIADFFGKMGINNVVFNLVNAQLTSELKNRVNRLRNCETNNIGRTVNASSRHSAAIEALEENNLISTLPEELEKTARMRLLYRDYSLVRLAAEFSPPITKSGLSHRLNKIVEIAENLLNRKFD